MALEVTPILKPGQTLTAYAGAADIEPGRFVKATAAFDSAGRLPCGHAGAGERALGVSQGRAEQSYDEYAQERSCPVNTGGIVKVEAGAAVTALADVVADASGRAVANSGTGKYVLGQALEAAAQAGDFIAVSFHPIGIVDEA